MPLTSTVSPVLFLFVPVTRGLDDHVQGDARPVGDGLGRALAGEDEQAVGGVVALDVELDLLADGRRAALELLERQHALAAAAGHLDEHVLAVDADDAPLLALTGCAAGGRGFCRVSAWATSFSIANPAIAWLSSSSIIASSSRVFGLLAAKSRS